MGDVNMNDHLGLSEDEVGEVQDLRGPERENRQNDGHTQLAGNSYDLLDNSGDDISQNSDDSELESTLGDFLRQTSRHTTQTGAAFGPSTSVNCCSGELLTDPGVRDRGDSLTRPPAFSETRHIWLAYLQAVIANAFSRCTVLDASQQLTDSLDLLELVNTLPTVPKPATTLGTARAQLGLDVDTDIEQYPICTECFKHYTMEKIKNMSRPNCTEKKCKGIVYCKE
ncbi:hypothetical protein K439DRAFT_1620515 [Ramaria rubella]|nr:hypothetical protein K439DRAFT_1620515 [Ramaria rubella]